MLSMMGLTRLVMVIQLPKPTSGLIASLSQRGRGAGAAQWMAERDRAAVDVQSIGIDGKFAQDREHLRRECLVQLDEVELA